MTPDEKALLQNLFDRVEAAKDQPRDKEAEALIADAVRRAQHAPYLLVQTVLLQEEALKQADQRLHELESRLQELEQTRERPTSFLGGLGAPFLSGRKTASGVPSVSRAPQPQYEPQPTSWNRGGYAPQPQGGSFLSSALSTAAGVAGGALLFQGISSLFQGGHAYGGLGGLASQPINETINIFENGAGPQSDFPADRPLPPDHQGFDGSDNVIREADFSDSDFGGSDFGGGDDGGWA
jgi:hypothetical protein